MSLTRSDDHNFMTFIVFHLNHIIVNDKKFFLTPEPDAAILKHVAEVC